MFLDRTFDFIQKRTKQSHMKKLILFTFLILSILSLISFQGGFGTGSNQAGTTAPGETGATCGQGGCHAAGQFSPSFDLFLIDEDGNQTEKYLPGETYTVSLKINHSGLPAGYGFQMVCLTEEGNDPINNFSDFPMDVGEVTLMGRQYVEQNRRLPVDSIPLTWTAPEKETGSVIFYAAGNAVNGNGSPTGDGSAVGNFVIEEDIESSTEELSVLKLGLFPNPASHIINMSNSINVASYRVYDFSGSTILRGTKNAIDISNCKNGAYLIQVTDKNGKIYSDRFIKI